MPEDKLYLIDASAFCYCAYFALKGLSTSYGQPTNAVYGFVNFLNKIFKQEKPKYLSACFDVSRRTFRVDFFADYKIQRKEMPDELSSQMPIIKEILRAYRISIFEKEGFEADDIIASLALKAREQGMDVVIVSSDKDILQLVDSHTVVLSPYQDGGVIYDDKKIYERFGIKPAQIIDFLSLCGDTVDNIPGAKGVGPKTAVKLINDFKSIDGILENIEKIKPEKLRDTIEKNTSSIELSRKLVQLRDDIDIEFDLKAVELKEPDYAALYRLFRQLEFKSLLKGLPSALPIGRPAESCPVNKTWKISEFCEGISELVLFFDKRFFIFAPEKQAFLDLDEGDFDSELRDFLAKPDIKKISHDLKGLKLKLIKCGLGLEGLYFDTMLAAYLLNPSRLDYSLSGLIYDYLGIVQGQEAVGQDINSCNLIFKLKNALENELIQKNLASLFFELEMPLIDVLVDMELAGVKVDLSFLKELSVQIEAQLADLIGKIFEASGMQFNINSPKQLREVLFKKLGLPVIKRTKTGPSTDGEVLTALAKMHSLPNMLVEYRKLTKIKSTYVDVLYALADQKTHRIHTSFSQVGTQTGRLSSLNPNLQNLPIKTQVGSQIRKAVITSGEDTVLISADYSQIELRILAHLSKDETLTAAFKKNQDIHRASASLIYGLSENDINEAMRDTAKRVNFGIIYGLSAYGLSRDLGITQDEAQVFIDAYFTKYPKVKVYIEEQVENAQKNGFVATILGRRRYITEINNKNQSIKQFAQRQAINAPIQGSASDLIKLAMVNIHNQIKEKGLKAKMILQIHDELLFDAPVKEADEFIVFLRERMENIMKLDVPVKVDVKKGRNWLEMEAVE